MNTVSKAFYTDLKKARDSQKTGVTLARLNNDGTPSKAHDAKTLHLTTEVALAHVALVRALNPGKVMRYAIDGREV